MKQLENNTRLDVINNAFGSGKPEFARVGSQKELGWHSLISQLRVCMSRNPAHESREGGR